MEVELASAPSERCRKINEFAKTVFNLKYLDEMTAGFEKYSESNPEGFISLSESHNALCDDIVIERLSDPALCKYNSKMLNYNLGGHGHFGFRKAAADFVNDKINPCVPLKPENLFVFNGVTGCISAIACVLTDEGDYILTTHPIYWAIDRDIYLISFTNTLFVDQTSYLQPGDSTPFQLTLEKIVRSYNNATKEGKRVKAILLVNPGNPIADVYPISLVSDIIHWAHGENVHVILDEIYMFSTFNEKKFTSVLTIEDIPDRSKLHWLWGMSKDFGMAGLRAAFIHTVNPAVNSALSVLNDVMSISHPVQCFLEKFLQDRDWIDNVYTPTNKKRLLEVHTYARKRLTDIGIPHLARDAGFFIWCDMRKFMKRPTFEAEIEIMKHLFDEGKGILASSGKGFRCKEPGWMRIVVTIEMSLLIKVFDRFEERMKTINTIPDTGPADDEFLLMDSVCGPPLPGTSLEELLSAARSQIKDSNWLDTNTAEQWAEGNPEVYNEYRRKLEKNFNSGE